MSLQTKIRFAAALAARTLQLIPCRYHGPYLYVDILDRKTNEAIRSGELVVTAEDRVRVAGAFEVLIDHCGFGGLMGVIYKTDLTWHHPKIGFWTSIRLAVATADARREFRARTNERHRHASLAEKQRMEAHYLGRDEA